MHDIIIIGGGVAAYSSALFAGRRGLNVLVLAKDIGGQANYTDVIENFPAHPEIGGYKLVSEIKKQAERWGVETEIAEVSKLKPVVDGGFVVQGYEKQYKGKSVILAFGKTPMDLGVPGEEELKGKGVSYCATCDAPLTKNRIVTVAGIGDIGLEAALLCAKFAKKVYTLSKTDKLTGHPALLKKVMGNKKIELVPHTQIQELVGQGLGQTGPQDFLDHLKCLNLSTGQQFKIECSGLFVEIGYVVHSDWLKGVVELDEMGQVVINSDQSTSLEGVFAAGDATNRPYKQAVISAGEGASAGLAAFDWLMRQRGGMGMSSDWTQLKKIKK